MLTIECFLDGPNATLKFTDQTEAANFYKNLREKLVTKLNQTPKFEQLTLDSLCQFMEVTFKEDSIIYLSPNLWLTNNGVSINKILLFLLGDDVSLLANYPPMYGERTSVNIKDLAYLVVKKSSKDITFEIEHSNCTSAEQPIFEQALLTYLQKPSFIISMDAQFNFSVISDKIKKEIEDLLAERKNNALLENLGIADKFKLLEAKIDKLTAEVIENNKLQKDTQEWLKILLQSLQSPENNLLQKMERVENSGNLGFWPTLNK